MNTCESSVPWSAPTAPATTETGLHDAVTAVAATKHAWAGLPIPAKMAMLVRLRRRTGAAAERWVAAACAAKGIAPESPPAGEEWLSGPYAMLNAITSLHRSLGRLWRGEPTYDPKRVRTGPEGRVVVRVMPDAWHDRLLLSGYRADVWMQPGVTPANLRDHTASFYADARPEGRVCLVLGAGNVAAIPPLDVLHKLYVEGQVTVLKMNPVNDYLGPIFEEIFAEFIERDLVRFVYGDGEIGGYLVHHSGVDTIHMTGSDRTHDTIVFGAGEEGRARRQRAEAVVTKPITSELGGISPVIVVPGPWREEDLRFQAEHFVTQKLNNSGFNCVAAQVLVVPESWSQTDRFVELVEHELQRAPGRVPYYPGADERRLRALERHEGAAAFGASQCVHLRDVDPESGSFAFSEEFFGAAFASTRLPGGDAGTFLDTAVRFANTQLRGSLGATLLVHPATRSTLGSRFDAAIARLRYGCIGINVWSAMGFLLPTASWGAFPGSALHDVGSGIGTVHNALMFDHPERTVVSGPFRPFHRTWGTGEFHLAPKPPWFVSHRTAERTARGLTAFAADGSLRHLPSILTAALRG